MQFSDLKIGNKARIIAFLADTHNEAHNKAYRQRLIAMGLIPGTEFTVSHMAPLGDPIEILVRGYALSLRKSEASILKIEAVATP